MAYGYIEHYLAVLFFIRTVRPGVLASIDFSLLCSSSRFLSNALSLFVL